MSFWELVISYGIIAVFVFLMALFALTADERWNIRRNAARVVVLAPVWPFLVIYWVWCGLRILWALTEWGPE